MIAGWNCGPITILPVDIEDELSTYISWLILVDGHHRRGIRQVTQRADLQLGFHPRVLRNSLRERQNGNVNDG